MHFTGIEPQTKGTHKHALKRYSSVIMHRNQSIMYLPGGPAVQWPGHAQIWKRPPTVITSLPSFPPPPPLLPAAVRMSPLLTTPLGRKVSMVPPSSPALADDNPAAREHHVMKDKCNNNDSEDKGGQK